MFKSARELSGTGPQHTMRPRLIYLALAVTIGIPLAMILRYVCANWYCVEGWYYCEKLRKSTEFEDAFHWRGRLLREPGADARLSYAFGAIGANNNDSLGFWLLALHEIGFRHIYDDSAPEALLTRHLTEAFLSDPNLARRYATLTMWLDEASETLDDDPYVEGDALCNEQVLFYLAIRFALTGHDNLVLGLNPSNARDREAQWLTWLAENYAFLVWDEPSERWLVDRESKVAGIPTTEESRVASITAGRPVQNVDISKLRQILRTHQ